MPIYEYHCNDCSRDFELLVMRYSEADKQTCPSCESADIQRKMSSFAAQGAGNTRAGASCSLGST